MAVNNFKVKTVSKKELLLWFRDNISPNLLSFDELGNGVDFCLGVDMLFPGVIGNRVIELTETTEYSKRLNFRRLQTALSSLNIKTDIPIDGLIKGSFKDMFAFGIWFKAFFEANCKLQPKDLDKIRTSHMKRWVRRKKQYECHKSKLYLKDAKRPSSDSNESASRNKGDCDSRQNNSENNVISNTEVCEDEPVVSVSLDPPSDLLPTVESSNEVTATEKQTSDQITDINKETFTEENKLKTNEMSNMKIPNDMQKFTGNSDADHKTNIVESKTDTTENNADKNSSTNPVTEGSLTMDSNPSSVNEPSSEKLIPSVMLSEQINIELENYNIHLKESLEKLNKKYSLLCGAVNEVKETLNGISADPIVDEPTEAQFCTIKKCCQHITKVLNDVNL